MNASYEWLKAFTAFDYTPAQLRDVITSRAATVDDVVALRHDLEDIVIGRVVWADKHPDSDHLSITKVDAGGGELLDVVCGAPNVTVGTLYPFAPVGATLPGGLKIEKRKIRGQASTGMLCSARELGLGGDHTGILALDLDVAPGTPFLQAMPVGDTRLIIDVGANRADLLSHEGVAREISAATGNPLCRPDISGAEPSVTRFVVTDTEEHTGGVRVRVDDTNACPLYIATVIRGVTVGPSPEWLAHRLEGAGVRSISNVVDVTNYMLHGFGQPMHAFDLSKLQGPAIVVRGARAGERITTLDGVERTLTQGMTVIADAERPQAIAGIIGGKGSEVGDGTTDILLEVAIFNPRTVRATRRALGVSTDSSYRFERTMDAHSAESLARYAAALIISVAGGTIDGAPVMVGGPGAKPAPVTVRAWRVSKLLGDFVSIDECAALLDSIGCTSTLQEGDTLRVTPPTWRGDIVIEADLIEEIARLRGYDSFSDTLRPFRIGEGTDAAQYVVTRRVTEALVARGLYEVRPLPFVADAGEQGVRVRNPLAESEAMLRADLVSTLATRVEYNFSHMTRTIRLFEVGVAFKASGNELPVERTLAAAILAGDRYPAHFTDAKPPQIDLWDIRALAESIATSAFGAGAVTLRPNGTGDGWTIHLTDDSSSIGYAKRILVDAPVWAPPVYAVEIDITDAFDVAPKTPRYRPIPAFPAAEFDLALLVPTDRTAADVEQVIKKEAGELLESLVPFDEFRGKGVADGYRSVAWRLTLRHPERTLREKEIEGRRDRILRTLDQTLGVRPRTS
jgi:phenylalanyl-tRNA synthetase beta chain